MLFHRSQPFVSCAFYGPLCRRVGRYGQGCSPLCRHCCCEFFCDLCDHVSHLGSLADRYGRKPMMLRASIAMTLTMGGIAFVPSVFWLLVLRLLNGVFFQAFVPNSTALIASQVPKDQSGYALGTLSTGVVAGTLMGPLIGGLIAENLGMRNVFLLVGFFSYFWFPLEPSGALRKTMSPFQKKNKNPVGSCSCPFSKKISSWDSFFDQHDHSNDRPIYFSDPASLCASFGTKR